MHWYATQGVVKASASGKPGSRLAFFMPALYSENCYRRRSGAPPADMHKDKGRSPFRKDYARLLHAPSFRRLQGKTQLFPGDESDFFRNRLTHSLEVAQVATGIAERVNAEHEERHGVKLGIDVDLVAFAALAHDLGHPPFGHNGEAALDEAMRSCGGFEGNAQTLHILAHAEAKGVVQAASNGLRTDCGLDLCYRSLAAVLKYDQCIPEDRAHSPGLMKGYYLAEKPLVDDIKAVLAPGHTAKFKTIECQIMDLADDIAYSTYDLEDSLHAGFVTPLSLIEALAHRPDVLATVLTRTNHSLLEAGHLPTDAGEILEHAARIFGDSAFKVPRAPAGVSEILRNILSGAGYLSMNAELASSDVERTRFTAERIGRLIGCVELELDRRLPILSRARLTRPALMDVEILKHLNFELVVRSPQLAIVEYRGKGIVEEIFAALRESEGSLLPEDWKVKYADAKAAGNTLLRERVLCDFIAGMTDHHAIEFHSAITGQGTSIFKRL